MSQHKCIFGLCVKNNAVGLPKVFHNISKFRQLFSKVHIVAYYDLSNDQSLFLLRNLAQRYGISITVLNQTGSVPTGPHRTLNIAKARNGILDWVMSNNGQEYDLFAMMDCNNYSCQGDAKVDVLAKYLANDKFNEWEGLTFARKPYYDMWALSIGPFHIGVWTYPRFDAYKYMEALGQCFQNVVDNPDNAGKLIEVDSAFAGFAIYKKEAYRGCRYSGILQSKYFDQKKLADNKARFPIRRPSKRDCEHRCFHFMGKRLKNARLMLAVDQVFTQ